MQRLEQGIYTRQQVIDQLHMTKGSNLIKFRYDLLDYAENKKATLNTVESGEIRMNALADIKRTARITLKENTLINWLSDKIQPFFMLRMPDGGWCEWSLGIFLLCSPSRYDRDNGIYREIECYDGLQVLIDDKFDTRYTIKQGSNYITAVTNILASSGITKCNLEQTSLTLPADVEFEPGTIKLEVINTLLTEINFTSLWVDEWGFFTASKYRSPQQRAADYSYKDDSLSILSRGMTEELDLFNIPNKWVVVSSNPETIPLTSIYTNSNPDSITSTINRQRTIVNYQTLDKIADQTSLDEYTKKLAFEASQVYGNVKFQSALMPHHSYFDVLNLTYSRLDINEKYSELGWVMPLQAGSLMTHTVRKVINI